MGGGRDGEEQKRYGRGMKILEIIHIFINMCKHKNHTDICYIIVLYYFLLFYSSSFALFHYILFDLFFISKSNPLPLDPPTPTTAQS